MEGSLQLLKQAGKVMAAVEKWSIYIVYTLKNIQIIMVENVSIWGKKETKTKNLQTYKFKLSELQIEKTLKILCN